MYSNSYIDNRFNRFNPYFRGNSDHNRSISHENSGQYFDHNFDLKSKTDNDFELKLIQSSISLQTNSQKPKYETIVLEMRDNCFQMSKEFLKDYFQSAYGSVKKVWFNHNNSKAFITFYNHISVEMIVESGDKVSINGYAFKVYPFLVQIPQQLCSTSGQQSYQLSTLCKTTNRSLSAVFPIRQKESELRVGFKSNLNQNDFLDFIKIRKIDKNELLSQLSNCEHFEQQMTVFLNTISLTDYEMESRFQLKDKLQEVLNSRDIDCRLHFFGSTVNKLGFRDSDIDVFVHFVGKMQSNSGQKALNFQQSMHLLRKIQNVLRNRLNIFIPNPIPSTRCPIVILDFNKMRTFGDCPAIVCDISLNNGLAEHNSRLIRLFCEIEPRFHRLCLLLKFWAKTNGFIGKSQMSSYCFTHLVIFFCQTQRLLPSLDLIRQLSPVEPQFINGWNCSFSEDVSHLKGKDETFQTIPDLLKMFFQFYANFDFTDHMISTRTGLAIHKSKFWSESVSYTGDDVQEVSKPGIKLTPLLCIEDPFELSHNLCANLKYKTFDKFCEYLTNISLNFDKIFNGRSDDYSSPQRQTNDNLCDIYWGLSAFCREWDPIPNGYVFPDNFIGYTNLSLILSQDLSKSSQQLMQIMANRLIELTFQWLTDVYHFECYIIAKWDLIVGQLSPFCEFYLNLRPLDCTVMDTNTRLEFRNQLTDEMSSALSLFEREKWITEQIFRSYSCHSNAVPIHCHFALVMNCRLCFPTVELDIIDLKPDIPNKELLAFLRRTIASAVNDCHLLTVAKELTDYLPNF